MPANGGAKYEWVMGASLNVPPATLALRGIAATTSVQMNIKTALTA
jgi:hypothetical protein